MKQIFSGVTTSTLESSSYSLPQHCSVAQTAEAEHKTIIHLFFKQAGKLRAKTRAGLPKGSWDITLSESPPDSVPLL